MVDRDTWKAMSKGLGKLKMRMMGLVTRTKIAASVISGNGQIMTVDMLQGEQRGGAEYFEPHGLAGEVPPGAEGLAFAVGGSRDQIVVLCASRKSDTPDGRLPGEVDLYGLLKQRVRMHALGDISLEQVTGRVVYIGGTVNPLLPFVARNGDPVTLSPELLTWITNVTAVLNVVPGTIQAIAGGNSGVVAATSKGVKAG